MEVVEQIPLIEILSVIVCLLFSAFFSSAETALTSLTREKALQLLEEKPSTKKYLRYWIENPNKIITLILIGNNVVNILATALVTIIAAKIFTENGLHKAFGAAVVTMTILILTFGEIIPKTIARAIAPSLALFALKFLIILYYLIYPIPFLAVKFSHFLGSILGVAPQKHLPMMASQKDLDFLIDLADKEGKLIGSKGEYLKAVAEFDDLKVRNIMIPRNQVTTLEVSVPIPNIMDIIEQHGHTRYPVYKDNYENFIGVLHVKDFLLQKHVCEEANSIEGILRPVLWTNEYMKIDDVLQMMKEQKNQLALIKDEYNDFSGIITMEDILEELVGEISDEHDKDEASIDINSSDIVELNGDSPIHDINEKFDLEIPEDKDFQTINGFLLSFFNGIAPQKNTIVLWKGFEIKICQINNNSIQTVEIKPSGNRAD